MTSESQVASLGRIVQWFDRVEHAVWITGLIGGVATAAGVLMVDGSVGGRVVVAASFWVISVWVTLSARFGVYLLAEPHRARHDQAVQDLLNETNQRWDAMFHVPSPAEVRSYVRDGRVHEAVRPTTVSPPPT